jgi:hypothetical protein
MYARILISVAAWAAGAVVATAGSLLAISVLGQGIVTGPVRTLSVDEVASALAAVSATPSASATTTAATAAAGSPRATATASATPAASQSASADTSSSRVLSATGGSVIASCTQAGAYLSSWSPAQGFQVKTVVRGPAYAAKVKFVSGSNAVVLTVVCQSGVPTASQTVSGIGDE